MAKNASDWVAEGRALEAKEKIEEALKCYDNAISLDPKFGRAYAMKAFAMRSSDKFQEAVNLFEKAIDLGYKETWVYNQLGEIYSSDIIDTEKAIKYIDALLAISPSDTNAWFNKGNVLNDERRFEEALKCYDTAISLDPNFASAYAMKALILNNDGKYQEAVDLYEKAIDLGCQEDWVYINAANLYTFKINNREKAMEYLDAALAISPDYAEVFLIRGFTLAALGRIEEAKECFLKYFENGGENAEAFVMVGSYFEEEGKKDEAMTYYNKGLEVDSQEYKCLLSKANLLVEQGKIDDGLSIYKKLLETRPTNSVINYQMALIYNQLGNTQEAQKCWEQGSQMNCTGSATYCGKGQCLNALGRTEEAMESFKKAQELMNTGLEIYTPKMRASIITALKAVLEVGAIAKEVEDEINNLEDVESNPVLQEHLKAILNLQLQQKEAQNKVVSGINKIDEEVEKSVNELQKLKEEFTKQLSQLKEAVRNPKKEDHKPVTAEDKIEKITRELDTKLSEFHKKLEIKIGKQDLTTEDKAKVQKYFKAFIKTFTSGYIIAQVVVSNQGELDTTKNTSLILSTLASFAPSIESLLGSKVNTVKEILQTKDMTETAKKMKPLASDTTRLSNLVGTVAYQVVINKDQQHHIIGATEQDAEEVSGDVRKKIVQFCENLTEEVDSSVYIGLYETPAERLAHSDANMLIGKWIKGEFTSSEMEKHFVQKILEQIKTTNTSSGKNENKDLTAVSVPKQVKAEERASSKEAQAQKETPEPEIIQKRCNCNIF